MNKRSLAISSILHAAIAICATFWSTVVSRDRAVEFQLSYTDDVSAQLIAFEVPEVQTTEETWTEAYDPLLQDWTTNGESPGSAARAGDAGKSRGSGRGRSFTETIAEHNSVAFIIDFSGSMNECIQANTTKLNIAQFCIMEWFDAARLADRRFNLLRYGPLRCFRDDLVSSAGVEKSSVERWMSSQDIDFKHSSPNSAFRKALELNPDCICVLTDGESGLVSKSRAEGVAIYEFVIVSDDAGVSLRASTRSETYFVPLH